MRSFRRIISLSLTVVLVLTTCQPCAAGEHSSDRYAAAAQSYTSADWQQAADQFRLFVAEHPDDDRALRGRFFLGEALVQLGRHDEAGEQFEQFLASDANVELKAKATFRLGEAYFLGSRLDLAATQLTEFLAIWPDDPMAEYALMYLGETALDRGETAEAVRQFTDQLSRFPAGHLRHDVRLALAHTYETQQRGDDAIAEYRRVADDGEADQAATALIDLASLQLRQRQYAQALETVDRFDTELTDHRLAPRARLTGGWARFQMGDLDGARASFEQLLADAELAGDSLTVDAQYGLAMVAADEGNAAEVVDIFDGLEIDAAHPLAAEIAYQRADALRRIGDTEAALAGFEQLLAESPDDQLAAHAHVAVLECLLALERYDELQHQAHEYLDVAGDTVDGNMADGDTAEDVASTNVRRLLAQAMTQRGQHAEAADVLSQLVERDGSALASPDDLYRLALLRLKQGDYDEALRRVEQMSADPAGAGVATSDGSAAVHRLHVAVLVELKRYADAVTIVDALAADELAVLEKSQLALLYAEVGRLAEAAELLDAVTSNSDRDDAYWAAVEVVAGRALDADDTVTAARLFDLMATGPATANVAAAGLFGGARCEWRRGDGDAALAALDRLAERYAQSQTAAEAALLRAGILAETRGGDPALAALEHVVAAHPGTLSAASALLRLARMYENSSQDADAAEAYTRFIDENPTAANRATAMLRNSAVLRRVGRAGEADGLLASLIDEYPDSGVTTPARLLLARSAFDKDDLDQAGVLVAAVLESDAVDDSTAEALYLQGLIAAAGGRWSEVDVSMRRLVAEYPEGEHRLSAEYWLAEAAYRHGELARAKTLLDELIRKTHGRRDHWVAMARLRGIQLLAREPRWQDVIDRCESLLRDFPGFQRQYEVDYLLGRALVGQAEFQKARQAFGRVVRSPQGAHTETAAMSQWMIGESYFHQRDYTSARQAYLLVDQQYDDFPQWQAAALLEAGKCSGQLEDWDEAARQFDQVVRHHPDSSHYDEAHQRLRLAEQKAPSPRQEIR